MNLREATSSHFCSPSIIAPAASNSSPLSFEVAWLGHPALHGRLHEQLHEGGALAAPAMQAR